MVNHFLTQATRVPKPDAGLGKQLATMTWNNISIISPVLELTLVSVISRRNLMQSPLSVSRKANQGLFF